MSGGGQPNLWPHFEEFVQWLSEKDISLGLITNGFPKNISESIYDKFDWIRLSITPEDASSFYPDAKFNLQYIPQNIIDNQKSDNIFIFSSFDEKKYQLVEKELLNLVFDYNTEDYISSISIKDNLDLVFSISYKEYNKKWSYDLKCVSLKKE